MIQYIILYQLSLAHSCYKLLKRQYMFSVICFETTSPLFLKIFSKFIQERSGICLISQASLGPTVIGLWEVYRSLKISRQR